ncbi:Gfo/Idh/MocA family protein [Psychromonas sp. KJ10-10]|uniref:Gfo/Idh/MocA family protein n=1 Tax=Psychromonas sp. KJ10-10 TaxID=3391823 RepID=UPI0039B5A687
MSSSKINIGLIGLGVMGASHASNLMQIPGVCLSAVCGLRKKPTDEFAARFSAQPFYNIDEMISSADIDALIIATPHFQHTPITLKAFQAGLHVLTEKPIAVHKADALKMLQAHHTQKHLRFATMFNQRTNPAFIKIKSLIDDGTLGEIRRVNWIITDWFRTEQYYQSGGWRGTWKGEGGGVLLNQCPHQLDLFQWLFGLPTKVTAFCQVGKYHNINVEDNVNAYCEFKNGATGIFIASTGEAPGTNRLEITAEKGKLVYEDQKLLFTKNEQAMTQFSQNAEQGFIKPDTTQISIAIEPQHEQEHLAIIKNFYECIINANASLIAPAEEGIKSVELANSMILSSFTGKTITLPIDAEVYRRFLADKIDNEQN